MRRTCGVSVMVCRRTAIGVIRWTGALSGGPALATGGWLARNATAACCCRIGRADCLFPRPVRPRIRWDVGYGLAGPDPAGAGLAGTRRRPCCRPLGCPWNCSPANGPAGPVGSSTRFPSPGRPPAGAGLGTRPAEALLIKPARPKMRFFIDPGTPEPREQDPSASYRYVSASCVAAELPGARARVQRAGRLPCQRRPSRRRSATVRRAGIPAFILRAASANCRV